MADIEPVSDVSALTVQLLSAYLANNTVPSEQLAELIRSTKAALSDEDTSSEQSSEPEVFTGAVSVRKSLASPEHIISLIDGKPYKTLKRHLASRGLTPDGYRSRYNLPASYPMVAPAYTEQRRAVAIHLGLGGKVRNAKKIEEQDGSVPMDAPEEHSSPEPDAPLVTTEQSKKAPGTRAPGRGRAKAPAVEQSNAVETTQDGALADDMSETVAEPSIDTQPDVVANPTSPKAKRASAKKTSSAKRGKPRGKGAEAAVQDAEATLATDNAEGGSGSAKREPARRRGKISLFKGATDGIADSADGEGRSDGGSADNEQAVSATESKARTRKRMARQPKPETP